MKEGKLQLAEAEQAWERQMTSKLQAAALDSERMLQQLRSSMLVQQEQALEAERAAAQQRAQDALARADTLLAEQRERFHAELEAQRKTLTAQSAEASQAHGSSAREVEQRIRALKEQHVADLTAQQMRLDGQMEQLRAQQAADRTRTVRLAEESVAQALREREAQLRRDMQAQQQEEIQMLMQRLSAEHAVALETNRAAHVADTDKLRREAEQLRVRMRDLEHSAQAFGDSNTEAHQDLAAEQRRNQALQDKMTKQHTTLEQQKQTIARLEAESSSVRADALAESAATVRAAEAERDRLQAQYRTLRDSSLEERVRLEASAASRQTAAESRHAAEISSLHLRVKHALEKKELALQQAQQQLQDANEQLQALQHSMEA